MSSAQNSSAPAERFGALLFLSFGGPDGPDDVMPFLRNVTRGRDIPDARLEAVAEHYYHFGGISPINRLNRDMISALQAEFRNRGTDIEIFFGNRNWEPYAADAVDELTAAGHDRALVFPTSAWGGYSACRQYHEDIARVARDGLLLRKLPQYCTDPAFRTAAAASVRRALAHFDDDAAPIRVVFTAHSVPLSADEAGGARADGGHLYSRQVAAASAAVAADLGLDGYDLVWQSRSGPPHVPWLEPDVCDHLEALAADGVRRVVVMPIGFISDHLEVAWDLDSEAKEVADRLGMTYVRADTVGTDPGFIAMVADIIERYADGGGDLTALGVGDNGSFCDHGCCGADSGF
ncbi:MAG: ferrochelatase [Gordonia sp. (in: high G+C Gram-positive bacteria)]|uniref:ferrochelatase n=1 Tax=Gordonia sp. (in: high G+C Gram-positive bacteria) TaxID=84139 RepID=UPI0039E6A75F